MVLQGSEEGFAPPFDASLYGASCPPATPGTERFIAVEPVEKQPSALFGGPGEGHLEVVGVNGDGDRLISFTRLGSVERRDTGRARTRRAAR